jgi:hypothetical protein
MMLAAIRPDNWNLPLFVHVLGAMVLVGGLLVTAVVIARGEARLLRVGYLTLLTICLPGYLVMRVGAEWIYSREHLADAPNDPAWVGIGYITADAGGLLLLIALVVGGIGLRRLRGGGTALLRASLMISIVILAAYVVTIWAMGAKPA